MNDLVFQTDYEKHRMILLESDIRRTKKASKVHRFRRFRFLKLITKPSPRRSLRLQLGRQRELRCHNLKCGWGYSKETEVGFIEEMSTILKDVNICKPNFLKRHVKEVIVHYREYTGDVVEFARYLKMTPTFYSYLNNDYGYKSKYLDALFSETDANIQKKVEEVDDLFNMVAHLVSK